MHVLCWSGVPRGFLEPLLYYKTFPYQSREPYCCIKKMGNFLKPLLKIHINRISWITCSDASTLFDYSIVDPDFTQGTANLQLGGCDGEKCSLFDPVSTVKSHYRGNCFCSTLIFYQLGLGMGRRVFFWFCF